jgi:heme oxygenase
VSTEATLSVPVLSSHWLRTQTRDEHLAVEARLNLDRAFSVADLVKLLRGWRAIWREVQFAASSAQACAQATGEFLIPAAQALDWLQSDLASLGEEPSRDHAFEQAQISASRLGSLLEQPATTWGVAYVLRGSRLGGAVLARRVDAALALQNGFGTNFLRSSGAQPGQEWLDFRRRLDGSKVSSSALAAAVEAAKWTFDWVGTVIVTG